MDGINEWEVFVWIKLILYHSCEGESLFDMPINFVIPVLGEAGLVDFDVFVDVSALSLLNFSPGRDGAR